MLNKRKDELTQIEILFMNALVRRPLDVFTFPSVSVILLFIRVAECCERVGKIF